MDIESDEIMYEVTRAYTISGIEPVPQWGNAGRDAMLTPCTVRVSWYWTVVGEVVRRVTVQGYRTRKDGTRADMPSAEIYAYRWNQPDTWPQWLRDLADARPALVPAD